MKKMLPESKVEAIRKEGFLNRAVEAYRFFYPTVSNVSNFKALNDLGITENHDFIIQLTTPDLNVLTQTQIHHIALERETPRMVQLLSSCHKALSLVWLTILILNLLRIWD